MKRLRRAAVLAAGILSFSFASAAEPEAVPGEYLVTLKTALPSGKGAMSALGARLHAPVKSQISEHHIVVIKRPSFEKASSVIALLQEDPMVARVEPNYIYRINKIPNDPMFGQLWGMRNAAAPGFDIGAEQAWDIETGSDKVIVASIDTGVNYNHPDLQANMWVNEAELNGKAGVDDDGNGVIDDIHGYNAITGSGDPLDDHGHGSHTSGTIGARGDDGKGIVGVAWNVRIMAVKFLSKEGSGTLEDAIKAIDYATKMGAKIMSNSWGGGSFSQTLKEAIERTNQAGALFVAAAGNESNNNDTNPSYPASYEVDNVISVAAIDNQGKIASFSNYGKKSVHVGAPGVNITSAIANSGYDTWSGTSMATPHVSGIAALLMSHEPTLSAHDVKQRIIASARRIDGLRGKTATGGLVNAYDALIGVVQGPDMDDPANWSTVSSAISTNHPYADSVKQSFTVSVPNAKQFALHFARFETENNFDIVIIKDSTGTIVQKLSGTHNDEFSTTIVGSSATIEFTSDTSVSKYGFDVDAVAWR